MVLVFVVGGLVASIVAGVFLIEAPGDHLPGVALESESILVIERIAMLFVAWLLTLIVVARSLTGELPIEISGRGLRYADAATAQRGLLDSEGAFERMDRELEQLREAMAVIEAAHDELKARPRRYAVKDGEDGH
jgi:hypothetical protein